MRDRWEKILKLACLALGVLLLWQTVRAGIRSHPLTSISIPAVPTLTATTNTPTAAESKTAVEIPKMAAPTGTNAEILSMAKMPDSISTNASISSQTISNAPSMKTNSVSSLAETNALTAASGTNLNTASKAPPVPPRVSSAMGMPGMPGRKATPELPDDIKARVDRIYESELFGQVMRPMPLALLGIAGNSAFLRSANGQTGLVKEGDSLGETKLLRIGINRVLVEENGQKKELMIFEGYGGESLLTKHNETPDETTSK